MSTLAEAVEQGPSGFLGSSVAWQWPLGVVGVGAASPSSRPCVRPVPEAGRVHGVVAPDGGSSCVRSALRNHHGAPAVGAW